MTHPLRSLLFCPATASRRVRKLPMLGADAVAIDLEDAVATERKVEARRARDRRIRQRTSEDDH